MLQITCSVLFALEPAQILVIANRSVPGSVELAEYYQGARGIPTQNLLVLNLAGHETCTRHAYDQKVAQPVRAFLEQTPWKTPIRCLVTVFGVPLRVAPPQMNEAEKKRLAALRAAEKALNASREKLAADDSARAKTLDAERKALRAEMRTVRKADQGAALDSELALVLQEGYPLQGWMPNPYFVGFRDQSLPLSRQATLLVSRLDGPTLEIVKRVIDESLATEQTGLTGTAYFDARWAKPSADKLKDLKGYALYDHFIHQAAERVANSGRLRVVLDDQPTLFQPGQAPDAALYCGWYSLGQYIDAFVWRPGSVGYHIASAECTTLKKEGSTVWCKRMLEEGVAATLGPVAEPYLQAFPVPEVFFDLLLKGPLTLVESYFLSLPYLSWQMVLLGDPLYRPFLNRQPDP